MAKVRVTLPAMPRLTLVLIALCFSCGRSDLAEDDVGGGEPVNLDAGSSSAPMPDVIGAVVCAVPSAPGNGNGVCALCEGNYYCPRFPVAPPCPAGLMYMQPCTTTCIACGDGITESLPTAQGDAWLWQCVNGTYSNVYSLYAECP
jgi:hypothetical protein